MDFLTALLISTTIMASTLFTPTYGNGISTILTIKNCNIRNKFATENKLPLEEQAYPFKLDEYMGAAKLDKDGKLTLCKKCNLMLFALFAFRPNTKIIPVAFARRENSKRSCVPVFDWGTAGPGTIRIRL
jgi:hypothetical protein